MARKPAKKSHERTTPKARKPHARPSPYSPEQRTAIVERMKASHSPATIQDTIERPDFHVTTDIRATSDPLWRHLAAFRRRLMEGGTFTPAEWKSLLIDIRTKAHAAGLRPHLGKVEYIVATLNEAREGDPGGAWGDEPDNWSKVILTACGETGWIQLHDLLGGFTDTGIPADRHKRPSALEWAESWMNARERQLAAPAAVSAVGTPTALHGGTNTDWNDVQGRLLAKRERGEPFTTLRALADEFGCCDGTIRKAIDKSDSLKGWKARHARARAAPKATGLGAVVRDNTRQTTEPAPDDVLPDDDVDATMAVLIDQARPEERAKLNALDDTGRRDLVATFQAQNRDAEPSPLEPGQRSRKVKQHQRV